MLKILILVIFGVVLLSFIKQFRPEFSVLLKFGIIAAVALYLFDGIMRASEGLQGVFELAETNSVYFSAMLKMLGLCITAQIAENVCKDCGETALAGTVETAAKIFILLVALPAAKELVTVCLGWLQL